MQCALRSRIVSAVGHTRVHWGIVPQDTAFPYIRLTTVSDPRPEDLKGPISFRETRVQVDVMSLRFAEARSVADLIIAAVKAPALVDGVQFSRTGAEGPRDLGEDVDGIGHIYMASLDLLVWHSLA